MFAPNKLATVGVSMLARGDHRSQQLSLHWFALGASHCVYAQTAARSRACVRDFVLVPLLIGTQSNLQASRPAAKKNLRANGL